MLHFNRMNFSYIDNRPFVCIHRSSEMVIIVIYMGYIIHYDNEITEQFSEVTKYLLVITVGNMGMAPT